MNWKPYKDFCANLKDAETCQDGSIAPSHILVTLGDNQGGTGRHKCTNCAFKKGFEVGLLENGINDISIELVPAPITTKEKNSTKIISHSKIDFIEKEIRNKHLGLLGELFILKSEIEFLKANAKEELANKVKHVSVEVGDGLGYDILSYDINGKKKKIEVKTTRSDITRPFYLTRNELEVSVKYPDSFCLYRLFDFDSNLNKGKYYIINGDLTNSLALDALLFIAFPKPKDS